MYQRLRRRDFPAVLRDQGSAGIGVTLALHARFEGETRALCFVTKIPLTRLEKKSFSKDKAGRNNS